MVDQLHWRCSPEPSPPTNGSPAVIGNSADHEHMSIQAVPDLPDGTDPGLAQPNPIELLQRWQQFGGTWHVTSQAAGSITISLCRCDGGEEVQRLTSINPALLAWLAGRTSSE